MTKFHNSNILIPAQFKNPPVHYRIAKKLHYTQNLTVIKHRNTNL